jgi:hypothetical protein
MQHLRHSFYGAETWTLRKFDAKTPFKFRNAVLKKDGDQLDKACEGRRSVTNSQKRKEHPTYKTKTAG